MTTNQAIKLTEREKAIARGEDPDAIPDVVPQADAVDSQDANAASDVSVGSGDTGAEKPSGTTSIGGGKDAASAPTHIDGQNLEEKPVAPGTAGGSGEAKPTVADSASGAAGEHSTKPSTKPAWLDNEVRSLATGFGLSEEEALGFGSREAFLRSMRILESRFAAPSKPAVQPEAKADGSDAKPDAGKPVSKSPPQKPAVKTIDVEKYRKAGYDKDTLELVESHADLQKQNAELREMILESRQAEAHKQNIAAFHGLVDGMDESRFGKSSRLTKQTDENRRKLYDAAETIAAGILQRARDAGVEPQVPPLDALLRRAELYAFGEEVLASARGSADANSAEVQRIRRQAEEQSKLRRSVGSVRSLAGGAGRASQANGGTDASESEIVSRTLEAWNKRVGNKT